MGKVLRFSSDRFSRYKFYRIESSICVYRFLITNRLVPPHIRFKCRTYLDATTRKARYPYSRVHNFCLITGKSRGVISDFRLAHPSFNKFAKLGFLPGIYKASWL